MDREELQKITNQCVQMATTAFHAAEKQSICNTFDGEQAGIGLVAVALLQKALTDPKIKAAILE